MHDVTLICWSCGAKKHGSVARLPEFAFEVAAMADAAGWMGCFDLNRGRTLVFCGEKCRDTQITKAGLFRARPKRHERNEEAA